MTLAAWSPKIPYVFAKYVRALGVPVFHGQNRCSVVERLLADALIVKPNITLKCCFKVFGTTEVVAADDIAH